MYQYFILFYGVIIFHWWTDDILLFFSVDGLLDGFYLLAIMHNSAVNILCTSFCVNMFSIFFGLYLEVKLLGHMVTLCNFLMNCQTGFQSSYTILHSYEQCIRVLISPHPRQHLLLPIFLSTAIRVGMKWHFTVVSICISLWLIMLTSSF